MNKLPDTANARIRIFSIQMAQVICKFNSNALLFIHRVAKLRKENMNVNLGLR